MRPLENINEKGPSLVLQGLAPSLTLPETQEGEIRKLRDIAFEKPLCRKEINNNYIKMIRDILFLVIKTCFPGFLTLEHFGVWGIDPVCSVCKCLEVHYPDLLGCEIVTLAADKYFGLKKKKKEERKKGKKIKER